ncbi:MAG: hypothetical protein ACK502_09375 [Alphaproteobacteria bacterium]
MAEEIAKEVKAQEQAKNNTAARVAQLVALADAARASGNQIDLEAARQALGSDALLDAAVAMMEASVRGDLDNSVMQSALTAALAQQQLVEGQTARIVEDLKAATPAKAEEVKAEVAPAEVKVEAPVAEVKPTEPVNQVAAMRERLEAEAGKPHVDQLAAKRAEPAAAKGRVV